MKNNITEVLNIANNSDCIPSKDEAINIVESKAFYEKNYSDIKANPTAYRRGKNWSHMPWAIAYRLYQSRDQAKLLRTLCLAIILPWADLTDQLKRTCQSLGISSNELKYVKDNIWVKNISEIITNINAALPATSKINETFDLEQTTPYMLRNDGELLKCGDVHPYVKVYFNGSYEKNLDEFLKHPHWLKWFAENSKQPEVEELLVKLQTKPTEADFDTLNNLLNNEFCRVRTSNIKYKYGGDNGEIYFRICSEHINWYDIIWKVVMQYSKSIKFVTILKDYQTFGKQFDYCEYKGQVFNKMPVEEFLTIPGNPIVETIDNSLTEDIEKHAELNPKLWNSDNTLKQEVHDKILEIANDFLEGLTNDEIKYNLKDIKLVGSNCSYNYTKDSDLDIHLVFDLSIYEDSEKKGLAELLYSYAKNIWNKNHTIYFYDIPVELYVETENTIDLN